MWNGIANCNKQTNTTERLVAHADVCSKFVYEIIMFVVTNKQEWQYTPNMLYVFIKHQRGVSYGNYCWDIILGPCQVINTLKQRHDERHFKGAILKWIFFMKAFEFWLLIGGGIHRDEHNAQRGVSYGRRFLDAILVPCHAINTLRQTGWPPFSKHFQCYRAYMNVDANYNFIK